MLRVVWSVVETTERRRPPAVSPPTAVEPPGLSLTKNAGRSHATCDARQTLVIRRLIGRPHPMGVFDEEMTTQELLEQWREATRAAELAERLAKLASQSVERADRDAAAVEELARLAKRAAQAAERAAATASRTAEQASTFARESRAGTLVDAEQAVADTKADEAKARDRYHEAERGASKRVGS